MMLLQMSGKRPLSLLLPKTTCDHCWGWAFIWRPARGRPRHGSWVITNLLHFTHHKKDFQFFHTLHKKVHDFEKSKRTNCVLRVCCWSFVFMHIRSSPGFFCYRALPTSCTIGISKKKFNFVRFYSYYYINQFNKKSCIAHENPANLRLN